MRGLLFAAIAGIAWTPGAAAQCSSNLSLELTALYGVVEGIVDASTPEGASSPTKAAATAAVNDLGVFAEGSASGGPLPAACLVSRYDLFQATALAGIARLTDEGLTESQLRVSLFSAAGATLQERYTSTDRFQWIFGLGFAGTLEGEDIHKFKIISRGGGTDAAGVSVPDTSYIVQESNSAAVPTALTGLLVRLRDRQPELGRARAKHLLPTAVFGTAQLAASDIGPVSGVALGFGWHLVGGAHLLVGYSLSRTNSLRDDLRAEWDEQEDIGRLPLPTGETEESIKGTETANLFIVALGVPLSFGSGLGGT